MRINAYPAKILPRPEVTNHLGSVRVRTSNSGSLLEANDYYPGACPESDEIGRRGVDMPGRSSTGTPVRQGFTGYWRDGESGLGLYYSGARMYSPGTGRFFGVDPLAEDFATWSPYVYSMNSPMIYVDPDGREVRCADESECQRAANDLNALHQGKTGISVEATSWEVSAAVWYKPWTWGDVETVSGFRLSTTGSTFDFSANPIVSALYDVINSNEIAFDLDYVSGSTKLFPGTSMDKVTAYDGQGAMISRSGGGRVMISADGNRQNVPNGIVLMHELVGHGHPVGGSNAMHINRFYGSYGGNSHPGYHSRIGSRSENLGLFRK